MIIYTKFYRIEKLIIISIISEKILFKIIYSKIIYLNNKIINDIKDKNHQS